MNLEINAEPYYSRTFFLHPSCLAIQRDLLPEDFRPRGSESFLLENLIKQGFQHLFVPTSNVYLHSENGRGFLVRTIPYE